MMLRCNDCIIATDSQGYLKDPQSWCVALAETIAKQEGITLTPDHWKVICFLRDFYQKYNTSPALRMLVKAWQQTPGSENVGSHYFYTLFPQGPAKQASKIAGLPKPVKCL